MRPRPQHISSVRRARWLAAGALWRAVAWPPRGGGGQTRAQISADAAWPAMRIYPGHHPPTENGESFSENIPPILADRRGFWRFWGNCWRSTSCVASQACKKGVSSGQRPGLSRKRTDPDLSDRTRLLGVNMPRFCTTLRHVFNRTRHRSPAAAFHADGMLGGAATITPVSATRRALPRVAKESVVG